MNVKHVCITCGELSYIERNKIRDYGLALCPVHQCFCSENNSCMRWKPVELYPAKETKRLCLFNDVLYNVIHKFYTKRHRDDLND